MPPIAARLSVFLDPPTALRSAVLTGPRVRPELGDEQAVQRVTVKPITLRGELHFQFENRYLKKVTHRNVAPTDLVSALADALTRQFSQAVLRTGAESAHLTLTSNGGWKMRHAVESAPTQGEVVPLEHNRAKNYLLPEGAPIPFLVRLGVMTADGRVVAAKYDKFRQINRFLEMVADTLPSLPPAATTERPLRVVDFGSGKSYLTFALYHFLRVTQNRDVKIVGLDRKRDVIDGGNRIAADLGWSGGLHFETGDIATYTGDAAADMVVSLHACDTATDDALVRAVAWNASVILAVPCCQHEINSKLPAGSGIAEGALRPLLKHGILKERLAALVTDALRAEKLETAGYQVQVLEFIDMEHTPKNLLLRAVRRHGKGDVLNVARRAAEGEYAAFRDFWAVTPYVDAAFDSATSVAADA